MTRTPAPNARLLATSLAGWFLATLSGVLVVGVAVLGIGNAGLALPLVMFIALLLTSPAILLRGMMRREWGMIPAVIAGVAYGVLMGVATLTFNAPVLDDKTWVPSAGYWVAYAGAGSLAAGVWWWTEGILRGELF